MRTVAAVAGRRLLTAIPLLGVVSVVTYLLLYRAADPVARLRSIPTVREEDLRRLIEQQGLDEPWYVGYWRWLSGFVQGDWGVSATNSGVNAIEPVRDALPATLELMLLALVVSAVLGVALGVVSATRAGRPADHVLSGLAYVGFATPTFVAGVLLQLGAVWMRDHGWAVIPFAAGTVVALAALARVRRGGTASRVALAGGVALAVVSVLLWDRLGGDGTTVLHTSQRFSFENEGDVLSLDHLQHLVLPVLTLALVNVAVWSRFQRAALLAELDSDHVAAARARGLSERRVVLGHALRNSLTPMATLVALDLGAVLSGAVVTESVFSWPGMGLLLRDSAEARDINVAMAIVMIGAVVMVVATLLADLLQAALDPRVTLGRGRR